MPVILPCTANKFKILSVFLVDLIHQINRTFCIMAVDTGLLMQVALW